MRFLFILLASILLSSLTYAQNPSETPKQDQDIQEINRLNKLGYDSRLIDGEQTIQYAEKALKLAQKANYSDGIAEAYRIKGIGKVYLDQNEAAMENYLNALQHFKQANNKEGEAKVFNNIGNLYMDVDYDKALEYLTKSLEFAKELNMEPLLAGLYGNIGNIQQRKKNYNLALTNYEKSIQQFTKLNIPTGIIQNLQATGVAYFNLNQIDLAENYLLQAVKKAKEHGLNNTIARINITLAKVYISKGQFPNAEKTIQEGDTYAKIVKDPRLEYDYIYTSYLLEYKRKNYQKALVYLQRVYTQDSITYVNNISDKIQFTELQHQQQEKQRENELIIARQKYKETLLWASAIVVILSMGVIFLLSKNAKKSAQTNKQLTLLNEEISRQKDDLDRVNQHLEDIIQERTKDLRTKNKKLSEYSSHLSHQIRGPVATLKGLLILEKDQLIEQEELIQQIRVCVNDIDDKILNINESLNNPEIRSLSNR